MSLMRDSSRSAAGHRALLGGVATALMLTCVAAAPAQASERGRAERLYTKGLAELHDGHNDAAVALFQKAVEADPNDVRGLYYRALGYGHVGRYEEAVADLKKVVAAADPAIERDRLELGYALYRVGRYNEAVAELEIASKKQAPSASEATLLLGIVESRQGHNDAALTTLSKVEGLDASKALPAHYYQGIAAYRSGDTEAASKSFTWVVENGAGSPFAREAASFLDLIRESGGGKRYRLHAGLAFEYDSNVALAPDNNNIAHNVYGISGEDDGRAVITAGGQYAVVSTPNFHVSLGYDFLTSLHFDLERFDVQTHRFGGQAEWVHGPLSLGVATAYEHSLLDESNLLDGGTLLPWVRYDEGLFGHSEVYYRMRGRNYVMSPFSAVRDSDNHAVGVRQFFSLGAHDRNIIVGYRFDTDIADRTLGRQYDYNGDQFELGLDWAFTDDLRADAFYAYKLENFSAASSNRDDDVHQLMARLEKRVAPYVWLVGSYLFTSNLSDQKSFEYTRHITSFGVELRY